MPIPIRDIDLVPTAPPSFRVFTHANCPQPIRSSDGTTQILMRPNLRLYCANCRLNLDDDADWAVRTTSTSAASRSRMRVHDFRTLKREMAGDLIDPWEVSEDDSSTSATLRVDEDRLGTERKRTRRTARAASKRAVRRRRRSARRHAR